MDDGEVESRVKEAYESVVSTECSRILEKLLLDLRDDSVSSVRI